MMVASTMVPSRNLCPWESRRALISSKRPCPRLCSSNKMTEVQNRGLVGQGSGELQTQEPAHRLGLVEQVLHAGVAKVVRKLDAVDSKHNR